jgi:hypothetical protein
LIIILICQEIITGEGCLSVAAEEAELLELRSTGTTSGAQLLVAEGQEILSSKAREELTDTRNWLSTKSMKMEMRWLNFSTRLRKIKCMRKMMKKKIEIKTRRMRIMTTMTKMMTTTMMDWMMMTTKMKTTMMKMRKNRSKLRGANQRRRTRAKVCSNLKAKKLVTLEVKIIRIMV